MLVTAAYPAIVIATPPRRAEATKCLVRMETELEIQEIPEEDAPVVMTLKEGYVPEVTDWGGPLSVRMHGGRHYRPLMPLNKFVDAISDPLANKDYPRDCDGTHRRAIEDIYAPIRTRLLAHLGGRSNFGVSWPTRAASLVQRPLQSNLFASDEKCFRNSGKTLKLDHTALEQAEVWREFFIEGLDGIALIDGQVWVPTMEPCYTVEGNSGNRSYISAYFPTGLLDTPYSISSTRVYSSRTHFFAADEYADALAFAANEHAESLAFAENKKFRGSCFAPKLDQSLTEVSGYNPDRIIVHSSEALLGMDTPSIGLWVTGREMLERVPSKVYSGATLVAHQELCSAVDESVPPYSISKGLPDALCDFVDLAITSPNMSNTHLRILQEFKEQIELHLERFDRRPIDATSISMKP